MLNLIEKSHVFIEILERDEMSYADSFNGIISIIAENNDFVFLEDLTSTEEIENWITKLKSRIVMKEDLASLEDIIDDYISCG